MPDDTIPLDCQAENCSEPPELLYEVWVMTPPDPSYHQRPLYLCMQHAALLASGTELSVYADPANLDWVSIAKRQPS